MSWSRRQRAGHGDNELITVTLITVTSSRSRRHGIYKTRYAAGASAALLCVCVCVCVCMCACACVFALAMARTRTWWSLRVSSVCPAATMYAVCVCVRASGCCHTGKPLSIPSRSESRYPAIRVTIPGTDPSHGDPSRARGTRAVEAAAAAAGEGGVSTCAGPNGGRRARASSSPAPQRAFLAFFACWSAYRAGDVSGRGREKRDVSRSSGT